MLNLPRLVLLLLCGSAAGCAGLFPNSRSEISSPFMSFDEARNAIEQVIPYQTKVADLAALGFDPQSNYNVTLIPYPEIVGRLAPHPGVPLSAMDPGVQDCIVAQTRIVGNGGDFFIAILVQPSRSTYHHRAIACLRECANIVIGEALVIIEGNKRRIGKTHQSGIGACPDIPFPVAK